jgi:hypothetical protein
MSGVTQYHIAVSYGMDFVNLVLNAELVEASK